MDNMEWSPPAANVFSGSANPSFLNPDFTANAAGRDVVNIFNFSAPPPGFNQAPGNEPDSTSAYSLAVRGVDWLRGRLSTHRPLPAGEAVSSGPTTAPSDDSNAPPSITPGSSCESSPSSSQEGVALVSLCLGGMRIYTPNPPFVSAVVCRSPWFILPRVKKPHDTARIRSEHVQRRARPRAL
ncbi:hypothetical protein FA13DRAFT_639670 [Coprinellus micaceus]|uniref:Uncharacterized protein n=1 Tax=Coprinellus micaceus TaxID=71717 RepID=A0A4Y7T709_COPMI|nr:hypothetical protein FA13DRAFT_639670 [Coprinellus micaceus]